jgi:hypothetical protein
MAYFHRVVAAVFLCLCGGPLLAAEVAYEWAAPVQNSTAVSEADWRDTMDAACAWGAARTLAANRANFKNVEVTSCVEGDYGVGYRAERTEAAGGGFFEGGVTLYTRAKAPGSGSGGDGSVPRDFCSSMASGGRPFKMTGKTGTNGVLPTSVCYLPDPPFDGNDSTKGCATTLGDIVAVPNGDGSRSWSASAVLGATVCTEGGTGTGDAGTGPQPPKALPNPCPSGFPGTVNGATVCVPSVPDSGIGGTTKKEVTNSDGSKEITDTTTECNAGVCTTTTTKKNLDAAGNQVGAPSTTVVKESITAKCAANPGDKVCSSVGLGGNGGSGGGNGNSEEGPSSFGGDCAAGFKAVSDDAVINAMAEETFRQNCKVNPDAMSQLKGQQANAADPSESIKKDNGAFFEREITSDMIQQTDYIGSGEQCMPDKSVSIHGQSFLIPFSNICDPMRYIGLIAVAASLVLAYRIIGSNK